MCARAQGKNFAFFPIVKIARTPPKMAKIPTFFTLREKETFPQLCLKDKNVYLLEMCQRKYKY